MTRTFLNHTRFALSALFFALSVAACGGLERTTVKVDRLMYGSVSNITVEGPNLDKGIVLLAPKCAGVKELEGSTPSQRVYACTPDTVGPMVVTVLGGGSTLETATFEIPVPQVTMTTSLGSVVLELDAVAAPLSSKNFLQYVAANFYTNLIFHRVIAGFVVQGGGFDASLTAIQTRDPIKLEVPNGLSNLRGTLAMARSTELNSATSQFYVNLVDNSTLDVTNGGYAVFGKVLSGLETIDAIAAVPTRTTESGMSDVPVTPVLITAMLQTQ